MSTFVLDPPPGTRVVAFFITARYAGQADRVAFSDVLTEQLLELLGEPKPTFLTDATRDAHLLGALSRAAALCRSNGERLILVVDGLDEDKGWTSGPDAHSIAALLPAAPPSGMRVIVASRLNPSVPADVPVDHPLRNPVVTRCLSPSPRAEVVRHDAERELKQLFHGSSTDRDLLGLVTAAGGGLSGDDLAYLTNSSVWEVENHLAAVTGRTFLPRIGRWQRNTNVYVLGHEELQRQAVLFLGPTRLAEYRARLHEWAELYRARRWPADTPDYLFRGYFGLLQATGDFSRMLAYATDPERHSRMLDLVGGDTIALSEIATAQETLLEREAPDVVAMSRLAVHRGVLESRNEKVPDSLPGVWAQLGRPSRAEALARSITNPSRQIRALTAVIRQVAGAGDRPRALILSNHAERTLTRIGEPYEVGLALALVARSFADAGDPQQAIRLLTRGGVVAESLRGSSQQAPLIAALARAWAAAGETGQALRLAASIAAWSERAQALAGVAAEVSRWGYFETAQEIASSIRGRFFSAQAVAAIAREMAAVGEREAAQALAQKAHGKARSIRHPSRQARALALVARALAAAGATKNAAKALAWAVSQATGLKKRSEREDTFAAVAQSMAAAGFGDRAEQLVRDNFYPARRARILSAVASGMAASGMTTRAEALALECESTARSAVEPINKSKALAALAQAAAAAGSLAQAERVAHSIPVAAQRNRALTVVAQAVAVAGDIDRAVEISSSISDPGQLAKASALIAGAAANLGQSKRAASIADSISDSNQRRKALDNLSAAKPANGVPSRASADRSRGEPRLAAAADPTEEADCLRLAESIIAEIREIYPQAKALTALAKKVASSGAPHRALDIAKLIDNVQLRAVAFTEVAAAVKINDADAAEEIIDQSVKVIGAIGDPRRRDQMLALIVGQLGAEGDVVRAEGVAYSIESPGPRMKALAAIAAAAARNGQLAKSASALDLIQESSERGRACLAAVQSGVRSGYTAWAEKIARSITGLEARGHALTIVSQAVAAAGNICKAEEIACSLAGYSRQAQLLISLASNSVGGDSRRLVARALVVGDWQLCLPALVRIEPMAIEAIAEEVARSEG